MTSTMQRIEDIEWKKKKLPMSFRDYVDLVQ